MTQNKIYATNLTERDLAGLDGNPRVNGNPRDGIEIYTNGKPVGISFVSGIYTPKDSVALVVDKELNPDYAWRYATLVVGKIVTIQRRVRARGH